MPRAPSPSPFLVDSSLFFFIGFLFHDSIGILTESSFCCVCVCVCVKESVAGGSEDSEDDVGHEDSGDEEWQQALTVGGLGNSMSKGELASLIQQGARAILQTQVHATTVQH